MSLVIFVSMLVITSLSHVTSAQDLPIVRIGNTIRAGNVSVGGSDTSFLLKDAAFTEGVIFAFSAFFCASTPIRFQVWRPVTNNPDANGMSSYFRLIWEFRVQPTVVNGREDIYVEGKLAQCIRVEKGDRVGIFFESAPAAIPYTFNALTPSTLISTLVNSTILNKPGDTVQFDSLNFPYDFSVSAYVDTQLGAGNINSSAVYVKCPSTQIPRNESAVASLPTPPPVVIVGPIGATGLQGPPGVEGPMGVNGSVGATGPKGDKGDAGPPGVAIAASGNIGATGAQGVPGPVGPAGPPGAPSASQVLSPDAQSTSTMPNLMFLIWLIVLSALVVLLIIVLIIVLCCRRQQQSSSEEADNAPMKEVPTTGSSQGKTTSALVEARALYSTLKSDNGHSNNFNSPQFSSINAQEVEKNQQELRSEKSLDLTEGSGDNDIATSSSYLSLGTDTLRVESESQYRQEYLHHTGEPYSAYDSIPEQAPDSAFSSNPNLSY